MSHSKQVTSTNKYFIALIALFIIPISGLCIDIYVPSLPAISHYFHVEKSFAQLTITAYMLGLGVMQLFAGGISDSFGRRNPFLLAMLINIVATLFIPFAHDIYQLLFLRLIQGIMVAVIVVSIRAIIPDLFEGKLLHKMISYMTMAWSVGPIIAPAIGGYLQHYFGWQANFYFLNIYSILGFLLALIALPETSQHRHLFHIMTIIKRYKEMLFTWEYTKGLLINGLLYSIVILFSIVGPFLIQNVLHYSAVEYGHMALLIGLAWFLGAMSNRFLLDMKLALKAKLCLSSMLIISAIMALLAIIMPINIYIILIPLFLLTWLGGILFPNHFAHGISLFPKTTGSANALFGAFIFIIPGICSGFGSLLKSMSQLPLTITYIGLIICCLIIANSSFIGWKRKAKITAELT